MCARYTVYSEDEIIEIRAIIDEVSRKFTHVAVDTGEIFPTCTAPILMMAGNQITPVPAAFGFPKPWGEKGVIVNAKSETALEKPMFSKSLLTRRCVVPSTGFYEWAAASLFEEDQQTSFFQTETKPKVKEAKVKLHFNLPGEAMLYMAGMVSTVADGMGGMNDVFCILTTDAKHAIAQFHDRMPVILSADEREDWLNCEAFMREVLKREGAELEWKKAG
jgi:putative SOS response-associated peptidase YedK